MRDQQRDAGAAQLFERLLRETPAIFSDLPVTDKVHLATTCWSALEAILRHCDTTLTLRIGSAVLQGLGKRLRPGQCEGTVRCRGVGVLATDAGALHAALQSAAPVSEQTQRTSIRRFGEGAQGPAEWVQFVARLLQDSSTAGSGAMRVTALIMPVDTYARSLASAAELQTLRSVLTLPAVRDHLRHLSLMGLSRDVTALHGALREMPTLRHLEAGGGWTSTPIVGDPAIASLISECASLQRLRVSSVSFDAQATTVFLTWLAGASRLRDLRLDDCGVPDGRLERWFASGNRLGRLEVFGERSSETWRRSGHMELPWLRVLARQATTSLRELNLLYHSFVGRAQNQAIASILRATKSVETLCVETCAMDGDPGAASGGMADVLLALSENTSVKQAYFVAPPTVLLFESVILALEELFARNITLEELVVAEAYSQEAGYKYVDFEQIEMSGPRRPAVRAMAAALGGNLTLERLRYPLRVDPGQFDAAEFGANISRNRTLRELSLRGRFGTYALNGSDDGLRQMAQGLARITSLRTLDIQLSSGDWDEDVGNAATVALVDGLWGSAGSKSRLRRLVLRNSGVRDPGARRLAEALRSDDCMLEKLDLQGNDIGEAGMQALGEALAVRKISTKVLPRPPVGGTLDH
ncbi:unnamed protein product [Pedinophyceae sp. YPF-701]|nr:unnamed protein product [Pedinophyceae sp. YPF-701]